MLFPLLVCCCSIVGCDCGGCDVGGCNNGSGCGVRQDGGLAGEHLGYGRWRSEVEWIGQWEQVGKEVGEWKVRGGVEVMLASLGRRGVKEVVMVVWWKRMEKIKWWNKRSKERVYFCLVRFLGGFYNLGGFLGGYLVLDGFFGWIFSFGWIFWLVNGFSRSQTCNYIFDDHLIW